MAEQRTIEYYFHQEGPRNKKRPTSSEQMYYLLLKATSARWHTRKLDVIGKFSPEDKNALEERLEQKFPLLERLKIGQRGVWGERILSIAEEFEIGKMY